MSAILTDLGLVVTSIVSMATTVIGLVTSTPILLIPFAFTLIGGAIVLFKKLK